MYDAVLIFGRLQGEPLVGTSCQELLANKHDGKSLLVSNYAIKIDGKGEVWHCSQGVTN